MRVCSWICIILKTGPCACTLKYSCALFQQYFSVEEPIKLMKVALVHDYLNQMGGAERVVMALHEIFPDAPIYTSIYDPERVDPAFQHMDIRTSFMQKLPMVTRHHQPYLPFYPFAMERLDLRGYDLVLSSSSAFAKGVITRPETMHICYCHTP